MPADNADAINHDEGEGSQSPSKATAEPTASGKSAVSTGSPPAPTQPPTTEGATIHKGDLENKPKGHRAVDQQVSDQISAWAKQISESQHVLQKAIEKLSTKVETELQKSIATLTEKVDYNHDHITKEFKALAEYTCDAREEIVALKAESDKKDQKITELQKELQVTKLTLGKLSHKLDKVYIGQKKLETYSRKHNVIFEGVKEQVD